MLLLTITFANWKRMGTNEAEKAVTIGPLKGTLAEVESFYSRCGYQGGVSPKDTLITATEGDLIIGVVRLCEEEGVTVLRGMQVVPYRRRMGVGTRMLQDVRNLVGTRACWGIAPPHLEKFYRQVGFRFVEQATAPQHLQERLQGYLARYRNGNRIMCRIPQSDTAIP
jgi:N-acetylglutamate synthase-like GNAT family acetyltransferase